MNKFLVVCGVGCIAAMGITGVMHVNEVARDSVRASLDSSVRKMLDDSVTVQTSSDLLEFKNSELFSISYDGSVLDDVNVLTRRRDYSNAINYSLKDDGMSLVCRAMQASSDSYYFVKSISEDLELVQTAEGRDLNKDKLKQDLKPSAELSIADYFSDDVPDNTKVESDLLAIGKLRDWQISYDNGLFLDWSDICDYVSYEDGIKIKNNLYEKLADKVARSYGTVGDSRSVKTPKGTAWVSGGTYGWEVDKEAESSFLKKSIAKRKSRKRTPAFKQSAWSGEYEGDIGNTYVVIDISEQHVWYFKNGKLKKESACVTGTLGRYDTPLGVYAVMEVMPQGKVLRGDGYETPVNKWIRLTNSGIGLHDATWRSAFGGSIYKGSGSHGCINLPYEFAEYLCKELKTGMPVVVVA